MMSDEVRQPTPITVLTGFLGSGKTTLILNLLPQLPPGYKVALLKNEFGDVAIDSQLASNSSIAGVRELLNGCICCNLVGRLGDALKALRNGIDPSEVPTDNNGLDARGAGGAQRPDRIIIETSGSAFPATLAMEVNRLAQEHGDFLLDGVVSVIDVENWLGYEDTSVTAKMQARYTDLIVLNKWEGVSERRLDDVMDRIGDLELDTPTPIVKSQAGRLDRETIFGVDGALARQLNTYVSPNEPAHDHQSEVEVISASLNSGTSSKGIDVAALMRMLKLAAKDEVYRIKAVFLARSPLPSSDGTQPSTTDAEHEGLRRFILNWAFGRWTTTLVGSLEEHSATIVLRMTIITARYEANKWLQRIQREGFLRLADQDEQTAELRRTA
ncbi:MAG: hypothetical protein Q9162_003919 [Coniocarpon cinnabarinum]